MENGIKLLSRDEFKNETTQVTSGTEKQVFAI